MSGRNLSVTQSGTMVALAVNVPANNAHSQSVWDLVSTALAALSPAVTDPLKVVGFNVKGLKVDNTQFGAIIFGGEDVDKTVNASADTHLNGYVAAGVDYSPPVSDPRNFVMAAPSGVNAAVPRVIEVYFSRGE